MQRNTFVPEGKAVAELPVIMASLQISETVTQTTETKESPTKFDSPRSNRSGLWRQCSPKLGNSNRRCNLKPAKLSLDFVDIESYYLNKKYKKPTVQYLETIYEVPSVQKSASYFVGPKKSRKIVFRGISKAKNKRRKMNAKKLSGTNQRSKLTMDQFLIRLNELMSDKPAQEETMTD